MSSIQLKKLYAIVPGFKHDKDEEWINYLSIKDQAFIKKCRETFVIMKDRLDEVKLEQKDHRDPNSPEHKAIGQRIKDETKVLDELIKTALLLKLPQLKQKAEKAQDRLIQDDFHRSGPSSAEPLFGQEFAAMASSFDAFLPSHILPSAEPTPPPVERPPVVDRDPARQPTTAPPKPVVKRDTYFDGVEDENIEIMKRIRPVVDKFDSRDRALAALRAIRHRDHWLDVLESLKKDFPSLEMSRR